MNKKNIFKKTAAIALGLALTIGATGCNFVLTDNEKDLAQTVAKVDITKTLAKDTEYKSVSEQVGTILKSLPSDISKRDLVAYFLSYGYQYVQNYGYSYKDAFNLLMNELVSREIMIQYAVAYYLKKGAADGSITAEKCQAYVEAELAALQKEIDQTQGAEEKANKQTQKKLLESHPEVLTLKYFLTNGGDATAVEDYNYTVYSLRKSFNDSLDNLEKEYVKVEDEEHDHATAQTLPNGVDTQKEKYYPVDGEGNLNYNVYTGRNLRTNCGDYESIDGSTTATRQRAYNDFLANLQSYNLVQNSGDSVEKTKDATLLDYYYVELSSSLGQALINKYFEDLEDEVLEKLDGAYATRKYAEELASQKLAYETDADAFTTALDSESETSISLYGLENFGFVYNILLPFSSSQSEVYSRAKNSGLTTDELYNVRKSLLTQIVGKDQRAGWINEHEDESYATYDEQTSSWNFFQDIISGESEYEELEHYLGLVPFDGTATLVDEKYEYVFNDVTVDSVVDKFIDLVQAQLGLADTAVTDNYPTAYEQDKMTTKYVKADGEVDYSKFVYRSGKIDIGTVSPYDYFDKTSNVYKLVSVANELMFAYSTDTGCLNSYMGYAISPISTNFMKEFEYAGQQAVKDGVGAYYVAPTDYGWHIIITTFAFKGGEVYGGYNHADAVGDAMVEGSFSNIYYEYLKSKEITSYTNEIQTKVINDYNTEECVKLFKDRYKDLLEM